MAKGAPGCINFGLNMHLFEQRVKCGYSGGGWYRRVEINRGERLLQPETAMLQAVAAWWIARIGHEQRRKKKKRACRYRIDRSLGFSFS
jgi:hypothetical protein